MTDDLGWPRTTRTPPGQHFEGSNAPSSDSSANQTTTTSPRMADPSAIDYDSVSDAARHIKIGIRQPRKVTRARPDKPDLLYKIKDGIEI